MREIVKVQSIAQLKRVMELECGPLKEGPPQGFSTFRGLEVVEDFRIPEGVYVMLPRGAALNHPEATVGAMTAEYAGAAASLRHLIRWAL